MQLQEALAEVQPGRAEQVLRSSETVLSEVSTQVKAHLGKVVYKGDFLPLLRKYRQDQDTPRLTAGARPERFAA